MIRILLISILLFSFSSVFSQRMSEEKRKEFEAQKVAFFTQEMDLTPDEATVFWPLYNEYQNKVRKVWDEQRQLGGPDMSSKDISEEDAEKMIKIMLESEQKVLDLKKEYFEKLSKNLSAKKIMLMNVAEQKFHRNLWKKMDRNQGPSNK